jgi:ABC-type multidrug transport system fused ATPase/permease subunit
MQQTNIRLQTFPEKILFILQNFIGQKRLLFYYLLIVVLMSATNAVLPYFLKLQIDQLENMYTTALGVELSPLAIFILILLIPFSLEIFNRLVLERFNFTVQTKLDFELRIRVENLVWEKVRAFDAGFFQSKRNKKILSDVLKASSVVQQAFGMMTSRLRGLITFSVIVPLLALVHWQLVVLIVVVAILQFVLSKILRLKSEGYTMAESRKEDQVWKIRDILEEKFFEVKTMGNVDELIDEHWQLRQEADEMSVRRNNSTMFIHALSWLIDHSLLIIANIFIGYQVMFGDVSIGTFVLVVAYTHQINMFVSSLFSSISQWQELDFDLLKVGFFFGMQSRLSQKGTKKVPKNPHKVELVNVSFHYPDHSADEKSYLDFISKRLEKWMKNESDYYYRREIDAIEKLLAQKANLNLVLKKVSIAVERGKIIALVGRNGSGKSTITHLLQHHYEPNEGRALLDGVELAEYNPDQLLKQFSWLTQQPFILQRYSIKDNLLLGSPKTDATLRRLEAVISDLKLNKLIENLPKKLDTIIDEDSSLSGGQMQLLAIARTLIQNRPFIIFDEGSSQLDVEKEYLVLDQLQKAKQNAGVLFITHRMSVARRADYIYVIEDGQIVEQGTHRDLIQKQGGSNLGGSNRGGGNKGGSNNGVGNQGGLYRKFWQMQMVE